MHSVRDKTVKKILFPLGEKELNATDYRILNCVIVYLRRVIMWTY